ncbi:MAG: NUDIX domain-containing protein [Candidatus Thermoplasmatota archaeon]|nr:NUDIX domain-containing protein [Candidatus Thermoplasmatota archaeon]
MSLERFVYVIAFEGDKFVMVRHRSRAWEMPGGRLLKGETYEQAAVREFFEETGMSLHITGEIGKDVKGGRVFVGLVNGRLSNRPSESNIAEVRDFSELPNELSFPLVEYETMLERAKIIVETFKRGKNIDASASPR